MKKSSSIVIMLIIVAVLIGGGYALFHKSKKTTPTTASTTSSQSNTPAINNAVLITKTASGIGQYLAAPTGKTLYTYGADTSGVSNCTGSCLATWPAYIDSGSTTNLPTGVSTINRSDTDKVQYTYMGMPLYYFASDGNGQVTGNGVDNFKVAKPSSASSSQSTSTPSTSTPAPSSSSSSSGSSY